LKPFIDRVSRKNIFRFMSFAQAAPLERFGEAYPAQALRVAGQLACL